jgi:hypothetical protein
MLIAVCSCKFLLFRKSDEKYYGREVYTLHDIKAGDILSSRHVSSCDVTSAVGILNIEYWRRLTILSTLLTSRDLTWSSGRLTCQHASQISVVAHIS